MTEASPAGHLHDLVKSGFVDGSNYDRNRPEYAQEAVGEVVRILLENQHESCGSDCEFLELGAGTGIMSRPLQRHLPSNRTFLASEPMTDFLQTLKQKSPDVRAEQFSAEAIPLPDNSVQGIVAAQCFHWFANETALGEIHRVLRPNGNIVLIWNFRDVRVDWVGTLNDMITCHVGSGEPIYINDSWKAAIDTFHGIQFKIRNKVSRDPIQYTTESLIACLGSISSMVRLPEDERSSVMKNIRTFLDTNPATANKTHFDMPMYTDILHYVKVT